MHRDGLRGKEGKTRQDLCVHHRACVGIVEEMPVAEDGIAEHLLCHLVYGVDGEVAHGGIVGDVYEDKFAKAVWVVIGQAGEEKASPVELLDFSPNPLPYPQFGIKYGLETTKHMT